MIVIIDEVMAQHAFPGEDAVGKRLWIPDMSRDPFQVVGVVGHVRHWGLAGDDQAQVRAHSIIPLPRCRTRCCALVRIMSIAVRTSVAPLRPWSSLASGSARSRWRSGSVRGPHHGAARERFTGRQRFLLLLFGIFAGLALLLACIGIYGVSLI